MEKTYFPLSSRVVIPGTATPQLPYAVDVTAQAEFLGYVEFQIPQAGILQTHGVKIFDNGILIYPAPGSNSDATFSGTDAGAYGALPPSGLVLKIPFDQRLRGKPSVLRFEYYSPGAGTTAVNVLIATYTEKPIKPVSDLRPTNAEAKDDKKKGK